MARKQTLRDSHLWNGGIYGPGADVEVPDDFPETLKGLDADPESDDAKRVEMARSPRVLNQNDEHTSDDPADVRKQAVKDREQGIAESREATLGAKGAKALGDPADAGTGDRMGALNTGLHTVTHPEGGHGDPRTWRESRAVGGAAGLRVPNPDGSPTGAIESGPLVGGDQTTISGRQAAAKTAAKTGGAPSGKTAVSREALSEMTVEELRDMAAERGIEVERGDGGEGAPLKADYIKALAK